ncbi:MAG: Kelch repeat-containing protein [Brevundimonas sp.]|uniref:Kelch repeat-containing protein n=1 Tax=Brevundimonas sp. TaxID=1871086 RepID=UPI00391DF000
MISRRTLMTAAGAVALTSAAAHARQGAHWAPRAPMPWAIQEIYAAAWGERIITAGGLAMTPEGFHVSDRTALYDTRSDAWVEGPRLPEARHHPMIVAADGKPYALGGYRRSERGDWTSTTDIWALEEDWTPAGTMPAPQAETVGVEYAGRIHLIGGRAPHGSGDGGWNDQGDVAAHRILDPRDGRWEEAAPLPMARNSAAACVLDGVIWVAGGRTVAEGGTGRLDRYDPAADRWDTLAPIPVSPSTGRQVGGGLAMGPTRGQLVVFGGEWFGADNTSRQGGVFAETWIYDPMRDAWTEGPSMLTPRHGLAAAAVGGAVYAIGGGSVVGGGQASASVEAFSP